MKCTVIIAASIATKEYLGKTKTIAQLNKMLSLITKGAINFAAFCFLIEAVSIMIIEMEEIHEQYENSKTK